MLLNDAIIYGKTTFCNTILEGVLKINPNSNEPFAFSNIPDSNLNEITGSLFIDDNLYINGKIFCNGIQWSALESMLMNDAIIYGTCTFCNTILDGVLVINPNSNNLYAFSNIPDSNLNEITGSLFIDDNLYINGKIFCNGIQWSAMNSMLLEDAIIYGTCTFCNTILDGVLIINPNSNQPYAFSNIQDSNLNEITGSLFIDDNLYINGKIFCNGIQWSSLNSMLLEDAIIYGTCTFCNTILDGILIINPNSNQPYAFSNIQDSNLNEINGSLFIDDNLYINGKIFCNGIQWSSLNSMLLEDAIIYGTCTFCNTILDGVLIINPTSNQPYAFSNIQDSNLNEITGSLFIDDNLYINGKIFCNGIQWSSLNSMLLEDAIIYGTCTFCNTILEGVLVINPNSNQPYAFSNIQDSNLNEITGSLFIDDNLYINGKIFCNGIQWSAMNSMLLEDAIIYGTCTFCNTILEGVLVINPNSNQPYAFSNISDSNLNEITGSLFIDDNLYINGKIFCNGIQWSSLNSMLLEDAIIYGTCTFCNTILEGVLVINTNSNQPYAFSNIQDSNLNEITGSLFIDDNLYINGKIFCNGIQWSSLNSMLLEDAIIYGKCTFCNTVIDGILIIGDSNSESYTSFSNIPNSNLNEVSGALLVDEDLYVNGRVFCNGFMITTCNIMNYSAQNMNVANLKVYDNTSILSSINLDYLTSGNTRWNISLSNNSKFSSDLIFKSANNTLITFTDDFTTDVLNFTAKHRCSYINNLKNQIGKIVVSTGKYNNLNNENIIEIDEAIPIVKLCDKINDNTVFGVISAFEDYNNERNYKIGNMKFTHEKDKKDIKVIVNSGGEGGIWICNYNGNLQNGDLIVSCIEGYGMKQDDDIVRARTVAKITCDCDFDKYEEFTYNNKTYRKAFVGCIYKF
jgi:hypothetical protein